MHFDASIRTIATLTVMFQRRRKAEKFCWA
jgi:hypothetical protein